MPAHRLLAVRRFGHLEQDGGKHVEFVAVLAWLEHAALNTARLRTA